MNLFSQLRTMFPMIVLLASGSMLYASHSGFVPPSQDAVPPVYPMCDIMDQPIAPDMLPAEIQEKENPLGITVEPVELSRGVRVKSVQENSLGAQMGLQAGDIITFLNGEMIYNTEKFQEVASKLPYGKDIEIKAQRGDDQVKAQFQLKAE